MRPALGGKSPETIPSTVDSPHPGGPTTETDSPARTSRDTSSTAVNPPSGPRANRLVTCSRRMVAWVFMTMCRQAENTIRLFWLSTEFAPSPYLRPSVVSPLSGGLGEFVALGGGVIGRGSGARGGG